ncbi:MAG: sigma-70 family RNA polymerase sigma factor [Candidatus Uhrbacteria bacterium]|nr:sigma-70 family RNA polymerase sigma factor [Candidatus Uhrbacteria bacterium]
MHLATDAHLVECAKGLHGQAAVEEAWRTITKRYQRLMESTAFRVVKAYQLVGEVVQTALMRAMVGIHDFEFRCRLSSWLRTITRRMAINCVRHERLHRGVQIEDCPEPRQNSDAEERVWKTQIERELTLAMEKSLDKAQIRILWMNAEGRDHNEISQTLKIAPGTVSSRCSRARGAMRPVLRLTANDLQSP